MARFDVHGYFGQDFTLTYTPQWNGNVITDDLSSLLVNVRIYDHDPSTVEITDDSDTQGTAIETISSWTGGTSTGEYDVAISAITDSDQTSEDKYEIYWAAIGYKLTAGEQTQYDVVGIRIGRVQGVTRRTAVVSADLEAHEQKIVDYLTGAEITTKINTAEVEVFDDLDIRGVSVDAVEWSDLEPLVVFKALEIVCNSLAPEETDIWYIKAYGRSGDRISEESSYYAKYNQLLNKIILHIDTDGDGVAEPTETINTGIALVVSDA